MLASLRKFAAEIRAWPWPLLVIALALALRLWGIDFGLPEEHARPDERHLIGFTLTAGAHRLNPGFFNYPSLYLYILFSAYAAFVALGLLTGRFTSPRDLVSVYSLAPEPLYLIDRCIVALLGTATVGLVYFIGARALNRRAGLLAALFTSVAYLHVRESHFGTVDVPMTFFATLAVALILRADAVRTVGSFAWAGFVAGLATSTKYNALALLVPIGLLHVLGPRATGAAGISSVVKGLAVSVTSLLVGFFVGTPYALLDHRQFLGDALYEIVSKARDVPVDSPGIGWIQHAIVTLPVGLGAPMLLASLAGVIVAFKERPRTAALLFGFPAAWFLGVGKSHTVYVRYAVPLVPMLCVFAAWFVDRCAAFLEAKLATRSPKSAAAVVVALGAVVMLPALGRSVAWDRLMHRTDNRVVVRSWVEEHVPSGASVGVAGISYIRPEFWSSPAQLTRVTDVAGTSGVVEGRRLRNEVRLAYVQNTRIASYDVYTFSENGWHDVVTPDRAPPAPPDYVIVPEHPSWRPGPGDLPAIGPEYVLAASFEAFRNDPRAIFDRQDAFYLPYDGFDGIERPGPNVRIYRRANR